MFYEDLQGGIVGIYTCTCTMLRQMHFGVTVLFVWECVFVCVSVLFVCVFVCACVSGTSVCVCGIFHVYLCVLGDHLTVAALCVCVCVYLPQS